MSTLVRCPRTRDQLNTLLTNGPAQISQPGDHELTNGQQCPISQEGLASCGTSSCSWWEPHRSSHLTRGTCYPFNKVAPSKIPYQNSLWGWATCSWSKVSTQCTHIPRQPISRYLQAAMAGKGTWQNTVQEADQQNHHKHWIHLINRSERQGNGGKSGQRHTTSNMHKNRDRNVIKGMTNKPLGHQGTRSKRNEGRCG